LQKVKPSTNHERSDKLVSMSKNYSTVLAFGTYDLLHPGHEFFLKAASSYGDRLVVIIARDENVEKIKGRQPRQLEEERRVVIAALPYVAEARLGYKEWGKHLEVLADIKPQVVCLGYDQRATIPDGPWQIVRIDSFQPDRYKSSIIRSQQAGLANLEGS